LLESKVKHAPGTILCAALAAFACNEGGGSGSTVQERADAAPVRFDGSMGGEVVERSDAAPTSAEADAGPTTADAAPPGADGEVPSADAAPPATDAALPEQDAGAPEPDAALPEPDADSPEPDAALPEPDAEPPEPDAEPPEPDAEPPEPDTGPMLGEVLEVILVEAGGTPTCRVIDPAEPLAGATLAFAWTLNGDAIDVDGAALPDGTSTDCDLLTCTATLSLGEAWLTSEPASLQRPFGPGCDDGEACTADACAPGGGCATEPVDGDCDDDSVCTEADRCVAGRCVGTPIQCADGLFCNGVESCDPVEGCRPGEPPALADGRQCIADDLLLRWTFDSPHRYGHTEPDVSGHSNDGVLLWSDIRRGGGGEYRPGEGLFGGAGIVVDRGTIRSRDRLTLPAEWTVSVWLRPTDVARRDVFVLFDDPEGEWPVWFSLRNGNLTVGLWGGNNYGFGTGDAFRVDDWVHLAVVVRAEGVVAYVDGVPFGDGMQRPTNWDPTWRVRPTLTGRLGGPHHRFVGPIDEFRIYGRPLGDADVAVLADRAHLDTTPRPIADPGLGYTVWMDDDGATAELLGGELRAAEDAETPNYRWTVDETPPGGTVEFEDPTDPRTTASFTAPGEYRLRLRAERGGVFDEGTVLAAVFDEPPAPENPPFASPRDGPLKVEIMEPPTQRRVPSGPMPLVAWWPFDEGDGATTVEAVSGTEVPLGDGHGFAADGVFGDALQVDCQALDLGPLPELPDGFTLSFWFNSVQAEWNGDLFRAVDGEGQRAWWLNYRGNSNAFIWWWWEVAAGWRGPDDWHHITIGYGAEGEIRKAWVDGEFSASRKFTPLADVGDDLRLELSPGCFRGMIDDVALYAGMLNNEEVEALFEGQSPGDPDAERYPSDPYATTGYTDAQIAAFFPVHSPQYVHDGFREDRFGLDGQQPPYEHPRLVFDAATLAEFRSQARSRDGHHALSQLRQYVDAHRLSIMEDGEYRVTDRAGDDGGFGTDNTVSATLAADALLALMDADADRARRVVRWMMGTAVEQRLAIDRSLPNTDDWRNRYHDILQRRATALLYDWMYPWMDDAERATIRGIIADATRHKWSIGMYAQPALFTGTSNWQNWITGELLLAQAAIYGEAGFDPDTFEAARQGLLNTVYLFADPESGASNEGMGKGNLTASSLAMLSRLEPVGQRSLSTTMPYHHIRSFTLHRLAPWGTQIWKDQKLGGLGNNLPWPTVRALHWAYPGDPLITYLKRVTTDGDTDSYGGVHLSSFGQNSILMAAIFSQDWEGPEDLETHQLQATEAAREPPGYLSVARGLMISRSDWSFDAVQLIFQPRSIATGHVMATRGYIALNAHGRSWVPF
jgi:hypothetical protein